MGTVEQIIDFAIKHGLNKSQTKELLALVDSVTVGTISKCVDGYRRVLFMSGIPYLPTSYAQLVSAYETLLSLSSVEEVATKVGLSVDQIRKIYMLEGVKDD